VPARMGAATWLSARDEPTQRRSFANVALHRLEKTVTGHRFELQRRMPAAGLGNLLFPSHLHPARLTTTAVVVSPPGTL
jgi:hypothetical protein